MANGAAGLVGGFVVDGSLSKTSVADDAGQKSELASLINAGFMLATMLFLASLFEDLPSATLGAIVIDAMIGLITFAPLKRYYRVNRADFAFFMGAGLGILSSAESGGILIGVVLSLVMLIERSSRTNIRRLLARPDVRHIPRRFAARGPEADSGHRRRAGRRAALLRRCRPVPTRVQELVQGRSRRRMVVDAEAVHLTDTDGADILIQVAEELQRGATARARACPSACPRALAPRRCARRRRRGRCVRHHARRRSGAYRRAAVGPGVRREPKEEKHDDGTPTDDPVSEARGGNGRGGADRGRRGLSRPKLPHFTPAERAARGKAARGELPRSAHAAWEPAPDRRRSRSISSRSRRRRVCRSSARSGTGACSSRRSPSSAAAPT